MNRLGILRHAENMLQEINDHIGYYEAEEPGAFKYWADACQELHADLTPEERAEYKRRTGLIEARHIRTTDRQGQHITIYHDPHWYLRAALT